jgi:AraC-like DNA-binding protein
MFGALGCAWLASTSLRTALGRLARYTDLVLERGAVEIRDRRGGDVTVTLTYQGSPFTLPALADALLSFVMRLCRLNAGDSLNPKVVTLFHSGPLDPGPYFAYFRCPVEFDATSDSLTLAKSVVDEPLPSANPHLAQLHDQEIVRYLARLSDESISLTQIAFMLGFSEPSAFTRAYRRWSCQSPSEARGGVDAAST